MAWVGLAGAGLDVGRSAGSGLAGGRGVDLVAASWVQVRWAAGDCRIGASDCRIGVELSGTRGVVSGIWPNPTHQVGPCPNHSTARLSDSVTGQQSQSIA